MLRIGEHRLGGAGFDDLAFGHHVGDLGHAAYDLQVVRDEQDRHAALLLQRHQQFEDLRLNGDVERGCRFVRNQQLRLVGERHGDHHPLPLAARELMRKVVEPRDRVRDADFGEQFDGPGTRRRLAHTAVQDQRFAHLPLDGVQRIERTHRLLENHRDSVATHPADGAVVDVQQVLPVEQDPARRMRCGRVGQEAQH